MTPFDANCMLGRRALGAPLNLLPTAPQLLDEMHRLGIEEALVYHAHTLDGHPADGNERLLREIAGHPRLHPCWVLLPSLGEMPAPAQLVADMRARGVRAARLCPTAHRYLFTQANVGDLLATLETARIPLLVDFGLTHWSQDLTDWRSLDDLCPRYPQLPFIVVGEALCAPRKLFPLWARHPNLHLETSYYQVHQGLSDIARRFGAARLLFGTGLPRRDPGMPLTQLRYDFLSDADRAAIGGDTLRALLAQAHGGSQAGLCPDLHLDLCRHGSGQGSEQVCESTDLPSHPIIDAHGHLGTWGSTYVHAGDAAGMVRSMDRLGIQATTISAFDAIGPDVPGGNDQVAAAMRAFPGRFLGYAVADPKTPEAIPAELDRCFRSLGFHGIKFHCDCHGYPADGDNYLPALEYADAHGLCILIHGSITNRMLESYPRAQFLMAHAGGWNGNLAHPMLAQCRTYPNIHLDLASSNAFGGAMGKMVEAVGADRIVHGSDSPLMDPGYQLGRVLPAGLSSEDRRKILHDNAARLFRL